MTVQSGDITGAMTDRDESAAPPADGGEKHGAG